MSYIYYLSMINEAKNYENPEQFLGSFGYPEKCNCTPGQLIIIFNIIYAVMKNDLSELVNLSNLTLKSFTEKYQIPMRTATHWKSGDRSAPEYVINLVGYAMISEILAGGLYEE